MKLKRTSMYLLILTAGCITAYINFSYDNNIEGIAPNTYVQSVSMRDLIEKANEDSEGDKTEVLVAKKENPIEQDKTFDNKQEEIIPLIVESLEESRVEKEISTEQIITID